MNIPDSSQCRQGDNLTKREEEIMALIASGMINKEIASELFISCETVKKHLHNIYIKLGVHNRIEALNKTWLSRA